MSDIKIQPSGSGTAVVTLTAPTTNTARTITFPDATGTLLNSGSTLDATKLSGNLPAISAANLTAIPAANITGTLPALAATNLTSIPAANITGTLPAISGANLTGLTSVQMPTGSVLQVVSVTANRAAATTSTSFASTGVTANITPSSTSSKILATYHSGLLYQDYGVSWYGHFTIFRGSTNLGNSTGGLTGMYIHTQSGIDDLGFNASCQVLDSPSSTSALTYTVQWRTNNTSARMVHDLDGQSTITLMEIAG